MIKKIFITGIILTFTLIVNNFTSASCYRSYDQWEGNYLHCDAMNLDYFYSNNGYGIGGFSDSYFNFTYFKFIFNIPEIGNLFTYWWQNDGLNYTYRTKSLNNGQYGRIKGFFYSSHGVGGNRSDIYLKDDQAFTYIEGLENLPDYLNDTFKYAYFYCGDESLNCKICLSDKNSASDTNGKAVCVDKSYVDSYGFGYIGLTGVDNLAISNPYFDSGEDDILSGGIELNSTDSALKYFEDYYGWDENVCYVGVDNVTDLWGSSVSFEEGSGLDIFDTFELLYGNTELTRMYVWMNAWLINYNQWFQNPEDRLYLANYNSGTNQVDLYYDNLTFPFNNQPVALYFMADNISNYTDRQTMASDVVSYCYIKLKGGTYDDIIDNSTKQSINQYTEKYNTNKGFNPDGTVKNIDYSEFGSFGDGTGDNSLKSVFGEFFVKNDFFKNLNVNSTYKILPDWLVVSFLFVVLFKLFRRRK